MTQHVMFHFAADWTTTPLAHRIQQPAEPWTPSHATRHLDYRRARDEAIVEALMMPFAVIVLDVLRHGPPEMPLPDRNQPVQAFFLDRPDDAFRVGVRIGRALGREHDADSRVPELSSHVAAHFRSRSQIKRCGACTAPSSAIVSVRTVWCMNRASGCGVDPRIFTRRDAKSIQTSPSTLCIFRHGNDAGRIVSSKS